MVGGSRGRYITGIIFSWGCAHINCFCLSFEEFGRCYSLESLHLHPFSPQHGIQSNYYQHPSYNTVTCKYKYHVSAILLIMFLNIFSIFLFFKIKTSRQSIRIYIQKIGILSMYLKTFSKI